MPSADRPLVVDVEAPAFGGASYRERDAVVASMDLSRHRASHDAWIIQETCRRTRRGAQVA